MVVTSRSQSPIVISDSQVTQVQPSQNQQAASNAFPNAQADGTQPNSAAGASSTIQAADSHHASSSHYVGYRCLIPLCPVAQSDATFNSSSELLDHISERHCAGALCIISPDVIRSMGLYSCPTCLQVFTSVGVHPANCTTGLETGDLQDAVKCGLEELKKGKFKFSDDALIRDMRIADLLGEPHQSVDQMPASKTFRRAFGIIWTVIAAKLVTETPDSEECLCTWKVYHLLPLWILGIGLDKTSGTSRAEQFRARVKKFFLKQWAELHDEALARCAIAREEAESRPPRVEEVARARLAQAKVSRGDVSKGFNLLYSRDAHLDINNPDVAEKLRALFPDKNVKQAPEIAPLEELANPDIVIKPECVSEALKHMRASTGAGISGWRANHFYDLRDHHIASNLAAILRLILLDRIPQELKKYQSAGLLTVLGKKDGSPRPIVVLDPIIRLLGRLIVNREQRRIASTLTPWQLGAGTSNGRHAIIHTANHLREMHDKKGTLTIDFKNAYNEVHREAIRAELAKLDPEISDWSRRYFNIIYR